MGINLAYTRPASCVALLFVTLPFVVRTVQPVLHGARPGDGAGRGVAGRRQSRSSAGSCCPTWCPRSSPAPRCRSPGPSREFGSTVLISGNIPFKTQVSAVQIFSQIESDNRTGAAAVSTVLSDRRPHRAR